MPSERLTDEEYAAVTEAWIERLEAAASTAGCNDLFEDEFPASVCERFRFDHELLETWAEHHERLVAEVRASREMLEKLEWAGMSLGQQACPFCGGRKGPLFPGLHEPGCALARLLGREER